MIAIIDPITATIVLSAIAGAVVGQKGKNVIDGLSAANTAANLEQKAESSLGSSQNRQND